MHTRPPCRGARPFMGRDRQREHPLSQRPLTAASEAGAETDIIICGLPACVWRGTGCVTHGRARGL